MIKMKTQLIFLVLLMGMFLNSMQAQNIPTDLNQSELLKQFVGKFQAEVAPDTLQIFEGKLFGTSVVCTSKFVTNGKTFMESKAIMGYDKNLKTIIDAEVTNASDVELYAAWFTSKNKCVFTRYNDKVAHDKAAVKIVFEFTNANTAIQTIYVDNNPVKVNKWTSVFEK